MDFFKFLGLFFGESLSVFSQVNRFTVLKTLAQLKEQFIQCLLAGTSQRMMFGWFHDASSSTLIGNDFGEFSDGETMPPPDSSDTDIKDFGHLLNGELFQVS